MSLRNNIVTIVALMLGAMTPSNRLWGRIYIPRLCCSINTDADSFCNATDMRRLSEERQHDSTQVIMWWSIECIDASGLLGEDRQMATFINEGRKKN